MRVAVSWFTFTFSFFLFLCGVGRKYTCNERDENLFPLQTDLLSRFILTHNALQGT